MKKRCSCGVVNDEIARRCIACDQSLRYAEEIPDDFVETNSVSAPGAGALDGIADDSSSATESLPTPPTTQVERPSGDISKSAETCLCQYPDPNPETGICEACDHPVQATRAVGCADAISQPTATPANWAPSLVLPNGHRVAISSGMVIGRVAQFAGSEMARYLAPFKGVSRTHLWIGRDDDAVLLLDLGSRNGTWINTGRVLPFTLKRLKQDELPAQIRLGANLIFELTVGSTI